MPHLFSYMLTKLFALSKQVKVQLHQQLSSKAESRDHRMMTVERVHVEFQEFPVSNCKLCHAGGKHLAKATCHRYQSQKTTIYLFGFVRKITPYLGYATASMNGRKCNQYPP